LLRRRRVNAPRVSNEAALSSRISGEQRHETLPGYEASTWYGLGAPKNTPAEIVEKLNKEINAALADPKMKARIADLGGTVLAGSPADFGKFIAEEIEKWGNVVKFSGAKAE
jgi:tripartite-type tricarboxylate transporter receptor subunit TctC